MAAVDSSAILRIRHQPQDETLMVTFVSGKTYAYDGVPAPVYNAFLAAESHGTFFNAHIRDRYPYRVVRS
jgi:hypothetical protein